MCTFHLILGAEDNFAVLEGADPRKVLGWSWDSRPFCGLELAQSHCQGLGDDPCPGRGCVSG